MSKYFNTKIRIGQPYSKREFAALQSTLFNLGCKWGTRPFHYRDEPDAYGIIIDAVGNMEWTRNAHYFSLCKLYEMSYACTTSVVITEPKRESVWLDNVQYDKDEFYRAIKDLKPVEY